MQSHGVNKPKGVSQMIQAILVLFGTFGLIVPLAILLLPSTGRFPPPRPIISESAPLPFWRPPKSQLSLNLRGLFSLKFGKNSLINAQQQRQMAKIIAPWHKRPEMSDGEAIQLWQKLNAVLTRKQRAFLVEWTAGFEIYRPPVLPDGTQSRALQAFRRTYNPFYPPEKHRHFVFLPKDIAELYQVRYKERMEILQQWRTATIDSGQQTTN